MAWRVGHDELPPGRREIAIGDVDRDALLALGLKTVDQQGEVEFPAPRCVRTLGFALDTLQLILKHQGGVVEQPADQRALAVVHASAGQKTQEPAILLGNDPGGEPGACTVLGTADNCLLYTSPSPRDGLLSRMPSS